MKLRKRPSDNITRAMRLAAIALIAVALWSGVFHKPAPSPAPQAHNQQSTLQKDCADNSPLANFSALAIPLMPTFTSDIRMQDTKPGEGDGAVCGQTATLRYAYVTTGGSVLYNNIDDKKLPPATFRIGDGTMLPGFANGILGQKPGGVRMMTLPASMAFAAVKDVQVLQNYKAFSPLPAALKNAPIIAQSSLLSLTPAPPHSDMPLRIITSKFGNGATAMCGDTVQGHISIWKLAGTSLFSTVNREPVTVTLGDSTLPYGIEQALIGMRLHGQRTVIMPPAYAAPLIAGTHSALAVALPNETVLVEIELLNTLERPSSHDHTP